MFRDSRSRNDKYPIDESALYLDKINGHPDNWVDVINDFPGLKINLAHFGGMQQWYSTEKELRKAYGDFYYDSCVKTWKGKIAELASQKDNVYTDISCYTFNSTLDVPDYIQIGAMETILSRLDPRRKDFVQECFQFDEDQSAWRLKPDLDNAVKYQILDIFEMEKIIPRNGQFRKLAAGLKKAITDNPNLKHKILMGSDWYMTEISGLKGSGVYYGRMFELLRYITKEMNADYDLWHQFSVVNTLNFLGFLQTDDKGKPKTEDYKGKKVCIWDRERIKKYLSLLEAIQKDETISKCGAIKDKDIDKFKEKADLRFEQLMHSKIFTSDEIKNSENKLLITSILD